MPDEHQQNGEAKLVKTHCCFCGVQCGIQLKVQDNKVIGFEPWEEFPVNHGMLCPKGVKRYLQNEHPDRLLAPSGAWFESSSEGETEMTRFDYGIGFGFDWSQGYGQPGYFWATRMGVRGRDIR